MNTEKLFKSAKDGQIMHAVMIVGVDVDACLEMGHKLASYFCLEKESLDQLMNYPDYKEIGNTKIKIADIRDLISDSFTESFTQKRRCYLINAKFGMSTETQNALLKTLEESPEDTLIILTGQEASFLQTIRSRCAIVRIGASDVQSVYDELLKEGYERDFAGKAASWAGGSIGISRKFCTEEYNAFRLASYDLIDQAMFGMNPFFEALSFIEKEPVFSDMVIPEGTDSEDESDKNDKKKSNSAMNIPVLLDIVTDVIRDALILQDGIENVSSPDALDLTRRIASNFTKNHLLSIIEQVMEAKKNLVFGISPKLTLDKILIVLSLKESRVFA